MLGGRVKTLHPKVHGGMWFIQDQTRVKKTRYDDDFWKLSAVN